VFYGRLVDKTAYIYGKSKKSRKGIQDEIPFWIGAY